jgi:hypothetical protein
MNVSADQRFDQVEPPYARAEVGALMALLSLPHFPDKFSGRKLQCVRCVHVGKRERSNGF